MTYAQARADHEYLWTNYGEAEDMTGAFVEGEKYQQLLRNPTKANAARHYALQIEYWFQAGPDKSHGATRSFKTDPEVRRIAARYLCEDELKELIKRRSA